MFLWYLGFDLSRFCTQPITVCYCHRSIYLWSLTCVMNGLTADKEQELIFKLNHWKKS